MAGFIIRPLFICGKYAQQLGGEEGATEKRLKREKGCFLMCTSVFLRKKS